MNLYNTFLTFQIIKDISKTLRKIPFQGNVEIYQLIPLSMALQTIYYLINPC